MVAVVVVVSIKSNTHPERVRILILLNIFLLFFPLWVPDKFTLQERKGKKTTIYSDYKAEYLRSGVQGT